MLARGWVYRWWVDDQQQFQMSINEQSPSKEHRFQSAGPQRPTSDKVTLLTRSPTVESHPKTSNSVIMLQDELNLTEPNNGFRAINSNKNLLTEHGHNSIAVVRYSSVNFNPTFKQQLKALSEHKSQKLFERNRSPVELPVPQNLFPKPDKIAKKMETKKKLSQGLHQKDVEDVANNLFNLKIETNTLLQDNIKLRTKNKNLEMSLDTLHEDLAACQQELKKLFSGEPITPYVLSGSIVQGLKRQVRVERAKNKQIQDELDALKKSVKVTSNQELVAQVELFSAECTRLRNLLKKEHNRKKNTTSTKDGPTLQRSDSSKRIKTLFFQKEQELQTQLLKSQNLAKELDQFRNGLKSTPNTDKAKADRDMQNQQALIIKQKSMQIKFLTDQVEEIKEKTKNHSTILQRSLELSKQILELKAKDAVSEKTIAELREKLAAKLPVTPKGELSQVQSRVYQPKKSPVTRDPSPFKQLNIKQAPVRVTKVTAPQFKMPASSNEIEIEVHINVLNQQKQALSDFQLVQQGIIGLVAQKNQKPQSQQEPDNSFFIKYEVQLQALQKKVLSTPATKETLQSIIEGKIDQVQGTQALEVFAQEIMEKLKQKVGEWEAVQVTLSHLLPVIDEHLDLTKFYESIEKQLGEAQEEVGNKKRKQSPQTLMSDGNYNRQRSQYESDVENDRKSANNSEVNPSITKEDIGLILAQQSRSSSEGGSVSGLSSPSPLGRQFSNSNVPLSGNGSAPVSSQNSITEEKMLDTAEQILNKLALKLIESGWTVHDVFGQPEEIIQTIPFYEDEQNVKILTARNFLGRVFQVGIQDLTKLQVACVMRVLGKPDLEDSVRYNELEMLLQNFGVATSENLEESKLQIQVTTPETGYFQGSIHNELDEDLIADSADEAAKEEQVVFIEDPSGKVEDFAHKNSNEMMLITKLFFLDVPVMRSQEFKALKTSFMGNLKNLIPLKKKSCTKLLDGDGFSSRSAKKDQQMLLDKLIQRDKPASKRQQRELRAVSFDEPNIMIPSKRVLQKKDFVLMIDLFMVDTRVKADKDKKFQTRNISHDEMNLIVDLFLSAKYPKSALLDSEYKMVVDLFMSTKNQPLSQNLKPLDKKAAGTIIDLFLGYGKKAKPLNQKQSQLVCELFLGKQSEMPKTDFNTIFDLFLGDITKQKKVIAEPMKVVVISPKPVSKVAQVVDQAKKRETESIKKFLDVFFSQTSVMKGSEFKILSNIFLAPEPKPVRKPAISKSNLVLITDLFFFEVPKPEKIKPIVTIVGGLTPKQVSLVTTLFFSDDEVMKKSEFEVFESIFLGAPVFVPRTPKKSSREHLCKSIFANPEACKNIVAVFQDLFCYTKLNEFLSEIDKISYKQIIKSKTKQSETKVIKQENFQQLIANYTKKRLSDSDIMTIRASVQITSKAGTLYEVMHVNVFVMETFKVVQEKIKRSQVLDAKQFETVSNLFFSYGKKSKLSYQQLKIFTDLFFVQFAMEKKPKTLKNLQDSFRFKNKMKPKDLKLVVDLFLDETPVITTPDFNMLFDLFLGKDVKRLTAKNAGTVTDLFLGYGVKPKMNIKDQKLMCDLFFDKTPVMTTPNFNFLYDIFLGRQMKEITAREFAVVQDIFFGPSKITKMSVRDTKIVLDMFLDKTPVFKSADFNVLYDLFLGKEVKPLTAKNAGTIVELFLGYGFKQKMHVRDQKLMCYLFLDKTPVLTTPNFNLLYDIFLGRQMKEITVKEFAVVQDIFFGPSKMPKLSVRDTKIVLDLFLNKTPVFNTSDFNMLYDLFMGAQPNKALSNIKAKLKVSVQSQLKASQPKNIIMFCDLFFGPGKMQKMSVRDTNVVLDLFLDNKPVFKTTDFNMLYDLFLGKDVKPLTSKTVGTIVDLFFGYSKHYKLGYQQLKIFTDLFFVQIAKEKKPKTLKNLQDSFRFKNKMKPNDLKLVVDLFLDETPVFTTPDFNMLYDLFLGRDVKPLTAKNASTIVELFLGYGVKPKMNIKHQKLMCDLFLDKTPVMTTPNFNFLYNIFLGRQMKEITAKEFAVVQDIFFGPSKMQKMSVRDTKLVLELFLDKTPVFNTSDFNMVYDLFMGYPPNKVLGAMKAKLKNVVKPLLKVSHPKNMILMCDLFFGPGKTPKLNVRDTKIVFDLFLDRTQVFKTVDFNMLYDLFMGKDVKPLTAKNAGTITDLFLGYGQKPKMNLKDTKLMCDLFFDKTPVMTTPNFNFLYDIFLGPEVKKITPKEFAVVQDIFFGPSKMQKMSVRDTKLVLDLFLNKTPVFNTYDFNMLYDLFLGKDVQPLTAKEFGTVTDLFLGYGKEKKMQAKDSKLMCDLFFDKTPVMTTPNFNMLYDLFLDPPRKILTALQMKMQAKLQSQLKEAQVKIFLEVFFCDKPYIKKSQFEVLSSLFTSPVTKLEKLRSREVLRVCDIEQADGQLLNELFFGPGKSKKLNEGNEILIMDLFFRETPVLNTADFTLLYEIFLGKPTLTAKRFQLFYSLWEGYGPTPAALGRKQSSIVIDLFFYESPGLMDKQFEKLDFIYKFKPKNEKMSNTIKSKLYQQAVTDLQIEHIRLFLDVFLSQKPVKASAKFQVLSNLIQNPKKNKPEPLDKKKGNLICKIFFGPSKLPKIRAQDEKLITDIYLWQKPKSPKFQKNNLKSLRTIVSAKHIKIFLDVWHSYPNKPYVKQKDLMLVTNLFFEELTVIAPSQFQMLYRIFMNEPLRPKEIKLVCNLFFEYQEPKPLKKNWAIMLTDLFFSDYATLGSVDFQTLFDLFMGTDVQRKLKPKEIQIISDLFFNYGRVKALSAKDAKMVVELFEMDVPVIKTDAFNMVYDIFMGTDPPKKKIDLKKIDRNKLALIKKAGKKYTDNLKLLTENNFGTIIDLFLGYGEKPKMQARDTKLMCELFLDRTAVFNTSDFNMVFELFMGYPPNKVLGTMKAKLKVTAQSLIKAFQPDNIIMVCDLFFGPGKTPKLNVRDTKIVLDLFLDRTQVFKTADFNMLYDLFLGKDVKPLTAKNAGTVANLFLGYGQKPKMNIKDTKLMCDLFFDKTPVMTTPNFNFLYDIFLGPQISEITPKEFAVVQDIFFGPSKMQKMSVRDTKLVVDLFLDKTPVFNTSDFNMLYDLFMGAQPNKVLGAMKAKLKVSAQSLLKASQPDNIIMFCDLFFGPGKMPKMSVRDTKLMLDLFLNKTPVFNTSDFNMLYDLFMGAQPNKVLGAIKAKLKVSAQSLLKASQPKNIIMFCDLFFGPGKMPKMSVRDTKLMLDLFLDKKPVFKSSDFNMLYDLFLGKDVNPLTAKEFGTVADLFLGFGQKPKMNIKDTKLMCDLFLSKTPVFITPDFNMMYDIFMGKEVKLLSQKNVGKVLDLFFGPSKIQKMSVRDTKIVVDLFLNKTPVFNTSDFIMLYDLFMETQPNKVLGAMKAKLKVSAQSLLKASQPDNIIMVCDLFFGPGRILKMSVRDTKLVLDLFLDKKPVFKSSDFNMLYDLFLGKDVYPLTANEFSTVTDLFLGFGQKPKMNIKDTKLMCDLFFDKTPVMTTPNFNFLYDIFLGPQISEITPKEFAVVQDIFFGPSKIQKMSVRDTKIVVDLFLNKTPVFKSSDFNILYDLFLGQEVKPITEGELVIFCDLFFGYGRQPHLQANDQKLICNLFLSKTQVIKTQEFNLLYDIFMGSPPQNPSKWIDAKNPSKWIDAKKAIQMSDQSIRTFLNVFFAGQEKAKISKTGIDLEKLKYYMSKAEFELLSSLFLSEPMDHKDFNLVYSIFMDDLKPHDRVNSKQKSSRKDITKTLFDNEQAQNILNMFHGVFQKVTLNDLLVLMEQLSYKQIIKSTTRTVETLVITRENVVKVLRNFHLFALTGKDLVMLDSCAQLTPKVPTLYALKHVTVLVSQAHQSLKSRGHQLFPNVHLTPIAEDSENADTPLIGFKSRLGLKSKVNNK